MSLKIHGNAHQIRREAAELHRINFTAIDCAGGIAFVILFLTIFFVGTKYFSDASKCSIATAAARNSSSYGHFQGGAWVTFGI